MTNPPTTELFPGDTVTLTITGKITEGVKSGTADATTLRISRPSKYRPGQFPAHMSTQINVDAVFEPTAEISYSVKSRHKNGVHLDGSGRYWLRRPDGWHEMTIAPSPVPNVNGQFTPPNVQRLKEDKEK